MYLHSIKENFTQPTVRTTITKLIKIYNNMWNVEKTSIKWITQKRKS